MSVRVPAVLCSRMPDGVVKYRCCPPLGVRIRRVSGIACPARSQSAEKFAAPSGVPLLEGDDGPTVFGGG